MQQSDLGYWWYFIFDGIGFERWIAESLTIALAALAMVFLWYWCIKGIFIAKVESKEKRPKKMDGKDRSLRA